LAVFPGSQAWAISLSFDPSASAFGVGGLFGLDVVISDLENDNLAAFDFNVNYDDAILEFDSYTLGTGLGDISLLEAADLSEGDLGGGIINLAELSWLSDFSWQADSFILATLFYIGIDAGESLLSFSDVVLCDDLWPPGALDADLYNGSVKEVMVPVPEPSTFLLLGGGSIGLAPGFRKIFEGVDFQQTDKIRLSVCSARSEQLFCTIEHYANLI
jgi:hypothetical protein